MGNDEDTAHISLSSSLETLVLSHGENHSYSSPNQSSFFRAIEEGNTELLQVLLKARNSIDINAYNDQGMTGLHLAVYKFETRRQLDIVELLLKSGANACLKAAAPPHASKLSIIRHDVKGSSNFRMETKKIPLDQKTPLLLALELKSALYLRGWEYRHWDSVLKLLASATSKHLIEKGVHEKNPFHDISEYVKRGWNHVFESGNHSLIEVSAEGKGMFVLKLLVKDASKKLKLNLESTHTDNLELKDVSFNLAKAMVKFIYTGSVDQGFMDHRGIDLFKAAHKYGVHLLKSLCEFQIIPTQENWMKLLTAANDCESDLLTLKCARSIEETMIKRQDKMHLLRCSFSDAGHGESSHLFQSPHHFS
ncbi:hypothetical protein KP509_23G060000 [Ceratopteris richardii]|nr:hypothetical protein KP509_23G060000 [Ceratopteris richardii]